MASRADRVLSQIFSWPSAVVEPYGWEIWALPQYCKESLSGKLGSHPDKGSAQGLRPPTVTLVGTFIPFLALI